MLLDKTLEELDGINAGEPTYLSDLVIECHRLRRVALKDFTDGDLRLLIGQKFYLDYLVPLALMRLMDEPLTDGDYYSGDLLANVLSLPRAFWEGHPDLRESLAVVVRRAMTLIETAGELSEEVPENVIILLRETVASAV